VFRTVTTAEHIIAQVPLAGAADIRAHIRGRAGVHAAGGVKTRAAVIRARQWLRGDVPVAFILRCGRADDPSTSGRVRPRPVSPGPSMCDATDRSSLESAKNRRTELRVPASTLGAVTTRVVGGSALTLLNYTSNGLLGQSPSRLLVGSRISVRLATATLNAIVAARVVRASLTAIVDGVPRYEVALRLEDDVDWTDSAGRERVEPDLDEQPAAASVTVPDGVAVLQDQPGVLEPMAASPCLAIVRWFPPEEAHGVAVEDVPLVGGAQERG
jgi:hypothetical protein